MPAAQRAPLERPCVVVRASESPPPVSGYRRRFDTLSGLGAGEDDPPTRRPATLRPDVDEALAEHYRDEARRILGT